MNATQKPVSIREEINALEPEVAKVLPAHISPERFMRVVMSAIAQNRELAGADRQTLLTACVKCATDGLVPDGREAALVIYKTKVGNQWVDAVQYMPMVFGILKLVRQSGEIHSFACDSVYDGDQFRYWVDDSGAHILHEPQFPKSARGTNVGAYAMFTTLNGGRYIEFVDSDDLTVIRSKSKSAFDREGKLRGPWLEFPDEMRIKSAIHRLFKRAPVSTEIDRTIRRLDDHYDVIEGDAREVSTRPTGNAAARDLLGVIPARPVPGNDEPPAPVPDPVPVEQNASPVAKVSAPMSQAEIANLVARLQKCKTVEAVEKLLETVPGDEAEWPLALAAKADEMREYLAKQ